MLLSVKLLLLLLLLLIIQECISKDILNIQWDDYINPTTTIENHHGYQRNYRKNRKINKTTLYNHNYQNQATSDRNYQTIEHLESDFGIFVDNINDNNNNNNNNNRWPRLQTLTHNFNKNQNNNNNNNNDIKHRINHLLKDYLARLYIKKYLQGDQNGSVVTSSALPSSSSSSAPSTIDLLNYQSKFVDSNLLLQEKNDTILTQFKNKTLNFINKFKQFLSFITIIKFDNTVCQTMINNINYMGVCYPQSICQNLNGTTSGTCANGYGTCCVFKGTCDGSSTQNCTYFENPGYPNYDPSDNNATLSPIPTPTTINPSPTPDPRLKFYYKRYNHRYRRQIDTQYSCRFAIYKTNANVQQMRIDFLDFELTGPINGTCMDERLVITGQNINDRIPTICGYNTGQHIYVDVTMLTGPLTLSVLSATGQPKRFRLRICQIVSATCTNSYNCLQYYTGVRGVLSSFNYDQAARYNRSRPGYFNNLNYALCIRKEAGYCTITFTNVANMIEYPFQFVNVDEMGQRIIPPNQAGVDIFNCPDDYVIIGGTRLCGDRFNDGTIIEDFTRNAPVTDSGAGPIVVQVRTNQATTGRGFKLFYTQNRCPTT